MEGLHAGSLPVLPQDIQGPRVIAALYVEANGIYSGLPDVELWDEARDARTYAGPWSVVAHPPCTRWCRLAGLVEARWGHKKGDDGGMFKAALDAVWSHGGVLEHPAYSDAWQAFGLPLPRRYGWHGSDRIGYVAHVEQGLYGHPARKATWLYSHGVPYYALPQLRWGGAEGKALVSACMNHTDPNDKRPRIMKKVAAATPTEFRDVLLAIARAARQSSGDKSV